MQIPLGLIYLLESNNLGSLMDEQGYRSAYDCTQYTRPLNCSPSFNLVGPFMLRLRTERRTYILNASTDTIHMPPYVIYVCGNKQYILQRRVKNKSVSHTLPFLLCYRQLILSSRPILYQLISLTRSLQPDYISKRFGSILRNLEIGKAAHIYTQRMHLNFELKPNGEIAFC